MKFFSHVSEATTHRYIYNEVANPNPTPATAFELKQLRTQLPTQQFEAGKRYRLPNNAEWGLPEGKAYFVPMNLGKNFLNSLPVGKSYAENVDAIDLDRQSVFDVLTGKSADALAVNVSQTSRPDGTPVYYIEGQLGLPAGCYAVLGFGPELKPKVTPPPYQKSEPLTPPGLNTEPPKKSNDPMRLGDLSWTTVESEGKILRTLPKRQKEELGLTSFSEVYIIGKNASILDCTPITQEQIKRGVPRTKVSLRGVDYNAVKLPDNSLAIRMRYDIKTQGIATKDDEPSGPNPYSANPYS